MKVEHLEIHGLPGSSSKSDHTFDINLSNVSPMCKFLFFWIHCLETGFQAMPNWHPLDTMIMVSWWHCQVDPDATSFNNLNGLNAYPNLSDEQRPKQLDRLKSSSGNPTRTKSYGAHDVSFTSRSSLCELFIASLTLWDPPDHGPLCDSPFELYFRDLYEKSFPKTSWQSTGLNAANPQNF